MTRRKQRVSYLRIAILLVLIGAAIYVDRVIVPVMPVPFIPTPTPTREPSSYVTDAQNFLANGKINQAVEAFKQASRTNPNNPSVFIELARLQIYTRDYSNALQNSETALFLSPNNSMAMAMRGWAQYFNKDYLQAEATLRNALEIDPNNALAHAFLAEVVGSQVANGDARVGGMDEAINESRLAVDLDPNSMETHRARGYVYEWTQNYDEAIQEFEKAIEINKSIADLHMELGINYFNKGNADQSVEYISKATDEFNKAIPLIPTDPWPKYYLARTYANLGEFAKAWQFAEKAVQDEPSNPVWHGYLGIYYRKDKQFQKAVDELALAIRGGTTPDGVEVKGVPLSNEQQVITFYWSYGLALSEIKQCGDVLQIVMTLRQAMPDNEDNQYNTQVMLDKCQLNADGSVAPAPTNTPTAKAKPSSG